MVGSWKTGAIWFVWLHEQAQDVVYRSHVLGRRHEGGTYEVKGAQPWIGGVVCKMR
jgi:hypothetical protein